MVGYKLCVEYFKGNSAIMTESLHFFSKLPGFGRCSETQKSI